MELLLPADPIRSNRVDEHFDREAAAAKRLGLSVSLIDHDAAARGDARAAVARVKANGRALYRGWMLSSDTYAKTAAALSEIGVDLLTDAVAYRAGHELPRWLPFVEAWTPESVWTHSDDVHALVGAASAWAGPAVLRDFTKSMKHYWTDACFVPDVSNHEHLVQVAERFRELRDDDFSGGFVLRRFETFTTAEVRTWWIGGRCVAATAHPDTPGDIAGDDLVLDWLSDSIRRLPSVFVTADLVLDDNERWRVVEIGDGQVSDMPSTADPQTILGAFV